ncbi:hypothetical protein PR202_gb05546 [Eleusine coracana subsp. coracana]|uniref:Uncharacterized protein n=1 Tax=Eleusine coracana subsp. coracana TaxID=191504 RepID=A0AAV5E7G0_ELECO|nr:hypothetical protein PR202_gb05546 [Eleusine coracana subsp. coracana]
MHRGCFPPHAAHLHLMALAACSPRFFIIPQPATASGSRCGCRSPRLRASRSATSRTRSGRAMAAHGGENSATAGDGASPAPPSLLVFSGDHLSLLGGPEWVFSGLGEGADEPERRASVLVP